MFHAEKLLPPVYGSTVVLVGYYVKGKVDAFYDKQEEIPSLKGVDYVGEEPITVTEKMAWSPQSVRS